MKRNIFYGLLNDEDSYSDALCNLCSIQELSQRITTLLQIKDVKEFKSSNLSTRIYLGKGYGTPDIIYADGESIIIFEVKHKTNTPLTDNQPEGYLDYISTIFEHKNYKSFIFLIPIGYKHEIQFEERYNKWCKDNKIQIPLIKIYWQDLIKDLSIIFKNNLVIREFCKQVDFDFIKENVMFTDSEMKLLEENTVLVLLQKIDAVIDSVVSELKKNNIPYLPEINDGGKTYYVINENGDYLFWFGRWDELWLNEGYALVVGCHETHFNVEKFKKCKFRINQYYDPITTSNNKYNIVDELYEKVKSYI